MNKPVYSPSRGFIVALILIVGFVLFAVWPRSHRGIAEARVRSMSNLRQIGLALAAHADANNGRLPLTLMQLSPEVINISTLPRLGFRDPDSKRYYDWLYLPRPSITLLPPETILAASPTAIPRGNAGPERLVLRRDGSVSIMPESEFQSVITKQLKDEVR